MNFVGWYEAAKKLLWPHVAVPLAAIVVLQYLEVISGLARAFCLAYVCLQFVAFALGVWAGMLCKLDPNSIWRKSFAFNLSRCFPLLKVGAAFADWALTESEPRLADVPAAPHATDSEV